MLPKDPGSIPNKGEKFGFGNDKLSRQNIYGLKAPFCQVSGGIGQKKHVIVQTISFGHRPNHKSLNNDICSSGTLRQGSISLTVLRPYTYLLRLTFAPVKSFSKDGRRAVWRRA